MKKIHFVALCAALGGLLFGYDTAVISGAIGNLTLFFTLSPAQTGWAISCALTGCLFGAFVSSKLSTLLGRKKSMIIAAFLFLICAIGTALPEKFSVFVAFRVIGGMGVGLASMVVPMYIAEIAPSDKRGSLVAYNQLAVVIGMVLVFFVNYCIALQGNDEWNLKEGWRWMFGSGAIPALLYLFVLFFIPESPRWYAEKLKYDEALNVLNKFNTPEVSQKTLEEMQQSFKTKTAVSLKTLWQPGLKKAMWVGIGLSVFQQITGINAILYYAPEIFKSFGSNTNASLLETSMLGVVNLIATIVSIRLVDKSGRLPLLKMGTWGMLIALMVVGFSAYFQLGGTWLLPVLLLFMASFSISWGPVVWVLLSEIFPNKVRSLALAAAVFIQWVANFMVSQTFPMMTESAWLKEKFNGAFPFILFALFCIAALIFVRKAVPETKNKTLEEMNSVWQTNL